MKAGTSDISATVRVTRSTSPSNNTSSNTLKYIAQYLPPGRKAWVTIGTYSSRSQANNAIKLAKLPVKSKTRVVPSQLNTVKRKPPSTILTPFRKD